MLLTGILINVDGIVVFESLFEINIKYTNSCFLFFNKTPVDDADNPNLTVTCHCHKHNLFARFVYKKIKTNRCTRFNRFLPVLCIDKRQNDSWKQHQQTAREKVCAPFQFADKFVKTMLIFQERYLPSTGRKMPKMFGIWTLVLRVQGQTQVPSSFFQNAAT